MTESRVHEENALRLSQIFRWHKSLQIASIKKTKGNSSSSFKRHTATACTTIIDRNKNNRRKTRKTTKVKSVPVSAAKLIEAAAVGEDDKSDFNVAQNRELSGLLYQSSSSLAESHMAITPIFDSLHLDLLPSHFSGVSTVNPSSSFSSLHPPFIFIQTNHKT